MERRDGFERGDESAEHNQRRRGHMHNKRGLQQRWMFEELVQASLPCGSRWYLRQSGYSGKERGRTDPVEWVEGSLR